MRVREIESVNWKGTEREKKMFLYLHAHEIMQTTLFVPT